jgi:peptidoglycan/LPS O-acetylase OafA/YrhL
MTWMGMAMIVAAAVVVPPSAALPGAVTAIPVLGAALVIGGGVSAPPAWGAERLLALTPCRWVGRWSYSWYLWHWPVLVIAAERAHTTVFGQPVTKNLVLTLLALGLAVITYFFVENPVRHSGWLRNRPNGTLVGAVLLGASCVALTYAF